MDVRSGDEGPRPGGDPPSGALAQPARALWFVAAWLFFVLGVVGTVLPLVPTTPFLLLALWAFSRCSARFHHWLYHHRIFGPPLQRWRRERVVPLRVKAVAVGSMLASMAWVTFVTRPPWYGLAAMAAVVAAGLTFIARVPSRPRRPEAEEA